MRVCLQGRKEKGVTALDPKAQHFDLMYEQASTVLQCSVGEQSCCKEALVWGCVVCVMQARRLQARLGARWQRLFGTRWAQLQRGSAGGWRQQGASGRQPHQLRTEQQQQQPGGCTSGAFAGTAGSAPVADLRRALLLLLLLPVRR